MDGRLAGDQNRMRPGRGVALCLGLWLLGQSVAVTADTAGRTLRTEPITRISDDRTNGEAEADAFALASESSHRSSVTGVKASATPAQMTQWMTRTGACASVSVVMGADVAETCDQGAAR